MERKTKTQFISGISLFVLFIIFTISLTFVDMKPIGPQGSYVAYATVNKTIHSLLGTNMILYHITDWAGVVAIFIAFGFAILGLVQWIKRKNILKVDKNILLLGIFYIVVFSAYIFFEFNVINRRPVLLNGILEASYPSSTTMLAMCILPTAVIQFNYLIKNSTVRNTVSILCILFTAFMVLGRLICGVHWFTDILGGMLFSISVNLIYSSVNKHFNTKKS